MEKLRLQDRRSKSSALIREMGWRNFRFDLLTVTKFHINYIICVHRSHNKDHSRLDVVNRGSSRALPRE